MAFQKGIVAASESCRTLRQRPDGNTFVSLGRPHRPIEQEQLDVPSNPRKEHIMDTREQPAPDVTAQDIERWLDADHERLRRLEARRLPDEPDEVLEAEFAMVEATIGQLTAELHYMAAVERRQRTIKA